MRLSFMKSIFLLFLIAILAVLVINVYVYSYGEKYILEGEPNIDGYMRITSPFVRSGVNTGAGGDEHVAANASSSPSSSPEAFPVAIILGASVYSDGTLSPLLEDRARAGVELYRAGLVKKILVSGDNQLLSYNEVIPIRAYLLENGVAPEDVFADFAGFNTYDSMYRAVRIFDVKDALIVTQSFHLPRALFTARNIGLNAYGVVADRHSYKFKNNTREIGATVKTFIEVVTNAKPRFLGPQIPITGDGRKSLPESFGKNNNKAEQMFEE